MNNWTDWFSAFLKGPGWFPGTGRLGDDSFVAEVPNRGLFSPPNTILDNVYVLVHFVVANMIVLHLAGKHVSMILVYSSKT